jgi:hypothetical protein
MEARAKDDVVVHDPADLAQPLGLGWSAVLEPKNRGAIIRLMHPEQESVAVEITITAQGPVIRASAAALEIESATDISARCKRFIVEASDSVTLLAPEITHRASGILRAEGRSVEVDAKAGDVRIHANDDVQVMGEQVLLNCERDTPVPNWLSKPPLVEVTLPRKDVAGDAGLVTTTSRE